MKFLGLSLDDHDSSVTYTDGTVVKYLSTEREYDIKHHGFRDHWRWQTILKKWDVSLDDIDAVAVILDSNKLDDGEVYKRIDDLEFAGQSLGCPVFVIDHHYAHALSLWPLGEVPEVNYVFDGYGNRDRSHTLFYGNRIVDQYDVSTDGSLGTILADIGRHLKMSGNGLDAAGKVTGLSAYGVHDKSHAEKIKDIPLKNIEGIWNAELWERRPNNDFFHIDWLKTCHDITADKYAEYILSSDGLIGYSGGIAQNCVINSKLLSSGRVVIPPHSNDSGLSLGAVEFLRRYYQQDEFDNTGFPFWQDDEAPDSEPSDETISFAAEALASGRPIGWYQGHGEIGPRALGNRSILMSARVPYAKQFLNNKVKYRENYRPYGAAVLREDVTKHFDCDYDVPYMNSAVQVVDSGIPGVTHVDNSCRIQTVSGDNSFSRLLQRYKDLTGDSVILNTSLNIGGQPIASKIWQAHEIYSKTSLEYLVVGDDVFSY